MTHVAAIQHVEQALLSAADEQVCVRDEHGAMKQVGVRVIQDLPVVWREPVEYGAARTDFQEAGSEVSPSLMCVEIANPGQGINISRRIDRQRLPRLPDPPQNPSGVVLNVNIAAGMSRYTRRSSHDRALIAMGCPGNEDHSFLDMRPRADCECANRRTRHPRRSRRPSRYPRLNVHRASARSLPSRMSKARRRCTKLPFSFVRDEIDRLAARIDDRRADYADVSGEIAVGPAALTDIRRWMEPWPRRARGDVPQRVEAPVLGASNAWTLFRIVAM